MQVQLLESTVGNGVDTCIMKLAGVDYEFVRNEHGHLVTEVTDTDHLQWANLPVNSAFRIYALPKMTGFVENLAVENGVAIFDERPGAILIEKKIIPDTTL